MNRDSCHLKDRIGEELHGYKITSKLAEGGMGAVWLATHPTLGLKAVVKVLFPQLSTSADLVRRFHNEAVVAAQISHAGIVKISNAGYCNDGCAYLLMELLEGQTLRSRIESTGRMPVRQVGDIVRQIASVLAAMHAAKIVHRDLKPDNVFLARDAELGERVKVIDLGIAKVGDGKTVLQAGTPGYAAPEQWDEWENIDSKVDVYALGVIAYEMASGQRLFNVSSSAEAHARQVCDVAPRLRSIVPDAPFELDALIAAALVKDPRDRPSVQDVHDVCARIAARATEDPVTVSSHRAAQSTLRPSGSASPMRPARRPPPRLLERAAATAAPSQKTAARLPLPPLKCIEIDALARQDLAELDSSRKPEAVRPPLAPVPLFPVVAQARANCADRPGAAALSRSVGVPHRKHVKFVFGVALVAATGAGGWQLRHAASWSREPTPAVAIPVVAAKAAEIAPARVVTPPPVVTATPAKPEPAVDRWLGTWRSDFDGHSLTITYEPITDVGTCGTLRYDFGGTSDCYGKLRHCKSSPQELRAAVSVKPECRGLEFVILSPAKLENHFQAQVGDFAFPVYVERDLPRS